jgi:hypothetical protein
MKRELRADLVLAQNIRALLDARHEDDQALATWCGHRGAWLSKALSGERGIRVKDLGKIADFFGLTVSELFQHGISHVTERRRGERRSAIDRRTGEERRQRRAGSLHPDTFTEARFPKRPA